MVADDSLIFFFFFYFVFCVFVFQSTYDGISCELSAYSVKCQALFSLQKMRMLSVTILHSTKMVNTKTDVGIYCLHIKSCRIFHA